MVCLGRYGDVINALPIAYDLYSSGRKPKFVVADQFWNILEGVTYVDPIVWNIDYASVPYAIKRVSGHEAYICQTYTHPDNQRLTDSYQKESWRVAGWLPKFGTIPLVFDNRSPEREKVLVEQVIGVRQRSPVKRKVVLVAGKSISSPFRPNLIEILTDRLPNTIIIDLCEVKAHRIYDILGLLDVADCLVSVDTVHLHLARIGNPKTVGIINNGWFGSCLTSNRATLTRYDNFSDRKLVDDVKAALAP